MILCVYHDISRYSTLVACPFVTIVYEYRFISIGPINELNRNVDDKVGHMVFWIPKWLLWTLWCDYKLIPQVGPMNLAIWVHYDSGWTWHCKKPMHLHAWYWPTRTLHDIESASRILCVIKLRSRQDDCHFVNNIFKGILLNGTFNSLN